MQKIEIFTTDYCPYCKKAEKMLQANGYEFKKIDITDNESEMRAVLQKMTGGVKTVPQIFVGKTHIGGSDDLEKSIKSGEFEKTVKG